MGNLSKHDDTKEIIGMLKQLSINVGQNDHIYNEFELNVTAQDVEKWIEIEDDEIVLKRLFLT